MKIVIVPSWYYSHKNKNRGNFIQAQVKGLANRGHDLTVIVFDKDSKSSLLKVDKSVEGGILHYRISVPWPWHRIIGFYLPHLLAGITRKILEEIEPDIVHAHAVRPAGIVVEHALRGLSIPWCLTEHSGPLTSFWWSAHGKGQIARAYTRATRLYAVSRALHDQMLLHFEKSVSGVKILYNGIDTNLFMPRDTPPNLGRLLFVGGFEKNKGFQVLLKALPLIRDVNHWTLSIVARGGLPRQYPNRSILNSFDDRVFWLGPKMPDEMPSIYAEHDIIIVPSLHETFSLVSAEALACGRTVIASNCGGPSEVVPEFGGILVPPANHTALANAINDTLSGVLQFDRDQAVCFIRDKFSMDTLLNNLERVYIQLNSETQRLK